MSERLMTPTRCPLASRHIIRDFWFLPIRSSAVRRSSSGRQQTISLVITSSTGVFDACPPARTRIARSRSVSVPSTFLDESHTGRKPIFWSRIRSAALWTVLVGGRHWGSFLLFSWIGLVILVGCGTIHFD